MSEPGSTTVVSIDRGWISRGYHYSQHGVGGQIRDPNGLFHDSQHLSIYTDDYAEPEIRLVRF